MKTRITLAFVFVVVLGITVAGQRSGRPLRSTLVYPPQRIALHMDHSHPAHVRLRCVRCHQNALESTRASDLLIPTEAACRGCHEETDREANIGCDGCHVGWEAGQSEQIPASSFPTANLNFSHQQHARQGVGCVECHDVQNTTVATRSHLPTMRSCFRCHGEGAPAEAECTTCHLAQPNGRLVTQFEHDGVGRMLPPAWLHGMDHDRDFMVRHRWVAADEAELCTQCHAERECVDCHDGRAQVRRVHPNDFLTNHATMARRNEPRCSSCHTTQRFCTECHSRLGLATFSAPAVAAGRAFHPPGWSNAHGLEARRSMAQCSSCHAERDCVACHGAAGIGIGISPHPPGFASRCRETLQRNGRACATCHGDTTTLCR